MTDANIYSPKAVLKLELTDQQLDTLTIRILDVHDSLISNGLARLIFAHQPMPLHLTRVR